MPGNDSRLDSGTLSIGDLDRARAESPAPQPFLFQVLCAADLLAPVARFGLARTDEIVTGRGRETSHEHRDRSLRVWCNDGWMSGEHCIITRRKLVWVARDAGARNGVRVNGRRIDEVVLSDGDVIELGRTYFVFRSALPALARDAARAEVAAPDADDRALRSLVPELSRQFAELDAVARTTTDVIVTGPSGTGKELTAREIHALSGRKGRFVAVNCGALPSGLIESELFGTAKGAFSGATDTRQGLVEAADGGTLFLDEIGDLPLAAQTKLLRTLQDKHVRRVGETDGRPVDFRLIVATHKDLAAMVERDEFREDLWARLSGYRVALPPLATRREDLGLLLRPWARAEAGSDRPPVELAAPAARALFECPWPRNIRQLIKSIGRARAVNPNDVLRLEDFPDDVRTVASAGSTAPSPTPAAAPVSAKDEQLHEELLAALAEHEGNISAVARSLGKHRSQIQRWIRRFGIDTSRYRDE